MELNRKNVSAILLISAFSITLFMALKNFSAVMGIVDKLLSYFAPFFIGAFIALIANVLLVPVEHMLFSWAEKKNSKFLNKIRRPFSLIVCTLIVVLILGLIIFIIAPEIKNAVLLIAKNIPSWWDKSYSYIIEILERHSISIENLKNLDIDWASLAKKAQDFIAKRSSSILNTTVSLTSSFITGIFNFVLGIVFSFYVLFQKEKLAVQSKKLMLAFFSQKRVDDIIEVASVSSKVFSSFIRGQTVEACIIGILCFIGMLIFRMPYAGMISVLIGVTALIPVFGAFLGTAVGALLIVTVEPVKAFWFIVFIIVLQQLEGDLIYPKVVGSSVGLPGIWVLVAATVGASAGGILGLFLSVPVCASLYSLISIYVDRRLKAKGIEDSRWNIKKNVPEPSKILKLFKKIFNKNKNIKKQG